MRGVRLSALRQRACLAVVAATGLAALSVPAAPPTVAAADGTPDFSINLSPGPSFSPGSSATITATVTPLNGETSSVSLVPSQGPALAAPAGTVVVAPYASVAFTLSADAQVPPGTYAFTLTGSDSNGTVHTATVDYTLTPDAADFSVAATPGEISVAVGTTGSLVIGITPSNGMSDDVQLSVAPDSAPMSDGRPVATWGNGTTETDVSAPYAPQQLTATVPPLTNPGSYSFTVTATSLGSASLVHSVEVTVDVVPSASGDFTLAISPGPSINPGTSGTFTATVTGAPGEVAPVVLTPVVEVGTVSPASVVLRAPYGSVQFTISVNANVPPGANLNAFGGGFVAAIAAVDSNGFTRAGTTEYFLTDQAADFGLQAPSQQVTIAPGATGSLVVQVPTGNGMNADVDLAVAPGVNTSQLIYPVALWSNDAPATAVGPPYPDQVVTFSVPAATPPGTYTFAVVGVSGNGKPGVVQLYLALTVS